MVVCSELVLHCIDVPYLSAYVSVLNVANNVTEVTLEGKPAHFEYDAKNKV